MFAKPSLRTCRSGLACLGVLGALLGLGGEARADCSKPFSDPNEVLTFNIRLARQAWDTLRLAPAVKEGCQLEFPRVKGEFKCGDGDDWMVVGLHRKRGDQRGQDTQQKPPFKIDFNYVVNGQSWPRGAGDLGYRKLALNQGQHDEPGGVLPDLLSEYMANRIMKREVPAAGAISYARVFVHFTGENKPPEYHGIYALHEDLDRSAIRRRYGVSNDKGVLLKTTAGDCRDQEIFRDLDANAAKTAFDAWWAKPPAMDVYMAETEKVIDLDELLRAEAVRDILANFNDTLLSAYYSNFFRYDPAPAPPRHYYPWDLDDCFKGPVPVYTTDIPYNFSIIPSDSDLGRRTRNHAAIRPRYYAVMCQLLNGSMHPDRVVAEIDQVHNAIKGFVAEEAGPVWGGKNPLDETKPWYYGWEYKRMRTWYPARVANVRQQLQSRGFNCPASCQAGQSEPCKNLTCSGKRACQNGLWTGCVPETGCVPGAAPVGAPPAGDGGAAAARSDGGATDGGGSGAGGSGGAGGAAGTRTDGSAPGGAGGASSGGPVGAGGSRSTSRPSDPGTDDPSDGADGGKPEAGCACRIDRAGRAPALGSVAFLALAALRRRRRSGLGRAGSTPPRASAG